MLNTQAKPREIEVASRLLRPAFLATNLVALAVALGLIVNALSPSADGILSGTDRHLYDLYRAHTFLGWKPLFEAGSFFGGDLMALWVPAAFGLLAVWGAKSDAFLLLVSTLGAWGGANLMKLLFASSRPRVREVTYAISGYGFPSAHAMVTLVFFGTFAFALTRRIRRGHAAVWTAVVVSTIWVGASRVALGSHWLTDVLAGWAFGLLWISGTWLWSEHWSRRPADLTNPDGPSERNQA